MLRRIIHRFWYRLRYWDWGYVDWNIPVAYKEINRIHPYRLNILFYIDDYDNPEFVSLPKI